MILRYCLIGFSLCLFALKANSQESVIWAAEVVDVSSEFGVLEFSALQTLHKPNVLPAGGQNPNAWRPKSETGEQFVMVSFHTPIKARQIAIAESENPGAIKKVLAYDKDYLEYTLFELNPRQIPIETRLLNLFFDPTPYEVHAIKVILDCSVVPGYNSIDAIGISQSNIPINVLVQMAKAVNKSIQSEKLSENVNSSYIEHSPIISADGKKLYFSRKYHPDNIGGVDDPEDIWMSEIDEATGEWKPAVNVGPPLNTSGPNYISSISQIDGKEMFILGNKYGKKGRMYNGTSYAYKDETGKYSEPVAVEIENEYNYSPKADFFLVDGGQVMLHAIERDDTYGGRDLYVSFKKGAIWSEPKNIGSDLNTASEEAAPFVAKDGKTLYFSSSGFSGYGGLDIYVTRRLDDTWMKWSPPDNLGSGINTTEDDQYFSIPTSGKHLYFTRGKVDDDTDIFQFKVEDFFVDPNDPLASSVNHLLEEKTVEILVTVSGRVLNAKTKEPIPNVPVYIERLPDGISIGEVIADTDGKFTFSLRPGARFGISSSKDGFIAQNENLDLNKTKKSEAITLDLFLGPIEVGQPITLNNIFFAFDKDELTTSSYLELERVLEYMQKGRIQQIEIAGHTDSKGADEYNLSLSKRRATSVQKYFIANGIPAERVIAIGFGESKPIDTNDTPEGRKKNRRVEFKLLEIN